MKVCNEIKRRIDTADNVESFDPDIERHTDVCSQCRRFADERAALRGLLASTARVTAPLNFDAMLQARLAEVKARRPLAWLNAAFYLRAGAATAALAVALIVTQYTGLLTTTPTKQANPPIAENHTGAADPTKLGLITPASPAIPSASNVTTQALAAPINPPPTLAMSGGVGHRPRTAYGSARRNPDVPLVTPEEAGLVDSGAIFIPGRNGQHDVTVPTVSVGAQSLIYVNAGRPQQPARAVSVSF